MLLGMGATRSLGHEILKTHLVQQHKPFGDIGYFAGIVKRGPWNAQKDVYLTLRSALGNPGIEIITPFQLHGSNISFLEDSSDLNNMQTDGILSRNKNYCLTVKTADCLPLILADPPSGLFGAVHIGWRGLAGGIIDNLKIVIKNLDIDFNRLYICLGPCIGNCCFEIGGDVAVLFDDDFVMTRDSRHYLDIMGHVKANLLAFGVPEGNISDISECTSCMSEKYYSYRMDRQAPIQMVSFICKK